MSMTDPDPDKRRIDPSNYNRMYPHYAGDYETQVWCDAEGQYVDVSPDAWVPVEC